MRVTTVSQEAAIGIQDADSLNSGMQCVSYSILLTSHLFTLTVTVWDIAED